MKINTHYWRKNRLLREADTPDLGVGMTMPAGPPTTQPGTPGDPMGANPPQPPQQGGPSNLPPQDLGNDPQYPEMPEENEDQDFEMWKVAFVKESIKGNPNDLEQLILKVRDKDLDTYPRKFVEDNLQIVFMRQHQDVLIPSKKIRDLVKKQLDRNLPAGSIVSHMTTVLNENPLVNNVFIKLLGCGGGKQDLHRKFIGSLLGAVQVGSGGDNEDLVFEEHEYSIRVSTRFNAAWGMVDLGSWSLKEGDPEKFLKEPELQRLDGGAPEERDVLRKRIILESLADKFKERAFVIHAVMGDGTIQHLGLDLSNLLRAAYVDGKIVLKQINADTLSIFIDEDGSVIAIPELVIYYVKEGDMNEKGEPELEDIEFMSYKNGQLFLKAQADLLKELAGSLQGLVFRETPWQGGPQDFLKVSRCVVSVPEQLLKQC